MAKFYFFLSILLISIISSCSRNENSDSISDEVLQSDSPYFEIASNIITAYKTKNFDLIKVLIHPEDSKRIDEYETQFNKDIQVLEETFDMAKLQVLWPSEFSLEISPQKDENGNPKNRADFGYFITDGKLVGALAEIITVKLEDKYYLVKYFYIGVCGPKFKMDIDVVDLQDELERNKLIEEYDFNPLNYSGSTTEDIFNCIDNLNCNEIANKYLENQDLGNQFNTDLKALLNSEKAKDIIQSGEKKFRFECNCDTKDFPSKLECKVEIGIGYESEIGHFGFRLRPGYIDEKGNLKFSKYQSMNIEFSEDEIENSSEKELASSSDNEFEEYLIIRGQYINFSVGDLFHHDFVDEYGENHDFNYIQDNSYDLFVEDENSDSGLAINPDYSGKYFDIYYKKEMLDLLGEGELEEVDVVYKMVLIDY